jgi:hypothetical protein
MLTCVSMRYGHGWTRKLLKVGSIIPGGTHQMLIVELFVLVGHALSFTTVSLSWAHLASCEHCLIENMYIYI